MGNLRINRNLLFGLGVMASIALIAVWFPPLNYHVLIGDDLIWLRAYGSGAAPSYWQIVAAMAGPTSGKFRPVSTALILGATGLCRHSYDCYVFINYGILAINAFLISLGAFLLSRKWWPSIFISSIAIIISRFSYYAIFQVMGLMENLSMTLVLLFELSAINFLAKPSARWQALIVAFYFLVLNSHERFIVLIVPMLLVLFLKRKHLSTTGFVAASAIPLVLTGIYLWVKQFVFHTSIFTGSGANAGSTVLESFRLGQFLSFVGQGLLNLIGFNTGPAYLSGEYFLDAGVGGILVGVLLSGTVAALIFVLVRQRPYSLAQPELDLVAFLVTSCAVLIVSSAVTPRQEYRWFYAPFAVFVLLACFLLGQISSARAQSAFAILVVLSFSTVDLFYKPYNAQNLYFEWSNQLASSVKREIIDKTPASILSQRDVYILTENPDVQKWILFNDYFFEIYAGVPHVKVHYIDALDGIPINAFQDQAPLVFDISNTSVTKVPKGSVQKYLSDITALQSNSEPEYDFISHFSDARIGGPGGVTPPTGRAAYLAAWKDKKGTSRQAMTLASPYTARFQAITCIPGSRLMFSAAIPYASSDGAALYIDLNGEGFKGRAVKIFLEPAIADGVLHWQDFDIPVAGCVQGPMDITFGADSPTHDATQDWIAIANLKLVHSK